ncbi:MAG: hypothetical protein H6Q74_280 [Firmicutes bacterium]|nr:hypothetical protein [Bacillota bacterium]
MDRDDTGKKGSETLAKPVITQPAGVQLGNEIVIYTMIVLQDLLVEQLINPVTNFNQIIALAATMAALNTSIKPVQ